jgi:hypothetical protein
MTLSEIENDTMSFSICTSVNLQNDIVSFCIIEKAIMAFSNRLTKPVHANIFSVGLETHPLAANTAERLL